MIWNLFKLEENDMLIKYAYSLEHGDADGIVCFVKATQRCYCEKPASKDTQHGAERLLRHLWCVVQEEGAPEQRYICIG